MRHEKTQTMWSMQKTTTERGIREIETKNKKLDDDDGVAFGPKKDETESGA